MISFSKISAGYQKADGGFRTVLREQSFALSDGQITAVMGRNGAGKSTLARICNGLLLPASGMVRVDELELNPASTADLHQIRRRVGMVFQNPDNQLVSATVEREIAFGLENIGVPSSEMRGRVDSALERFELTSMRHWPPHRLSGGEKQRVALAAVLAMRPRHLILDEPTALLDLHHRRELLTRLVRLKNDGFEGVILLTTHHPEEALFADRLLVLDAGSIVLDGPPAGVFQEQSRLAEAGISPPIEFRVYTRLQQLDFPLTSIDDLLLKPIL